MGRFVPTGSKNVWEGAIGDRKDMVLGHEAVGEVVEVGNLVQNFKPGDKVIDLENEFSTVTNEPGTALVMCVPSDGDAPINVNPRAEVPTRPVRG